MDSELVLDTWANLDFKSRGVPPGDSAIVSWVGDQRRRLNAYVLLTSYLENVSRYFLALDDDDEDERKERRELGDAQVIVDTLVSALLGNHVSIVCPDAPELEKWAQKWGKKAKLIRKMFQFEEHAVSLGDGVMVLSWDGVKKRVAAKVYDPGMYFPVLDGASNDDFPSRIHIGWEFDRIDADGKENRFIRKMTWDLRENEAGKLTCFYSDGEWELMALDLKSDYDNFPLQNAKWYTNAQGQELRDVDLKIDYIPIIHMPNTIIDDDDHFGKSSLATVLQIIDEIQATDSDLAKGSAIAGFPPLAADGAIASSTDKDGNTIDTYGPGTVFGGHLSTIDTSKSLDALIKYLDKLLARLAVNSHLPEAVIGRVRPSEVPSGLAFALGFAPLQAMIYRMRLIREEKYPLIFKFAHGLEKAAGMEVPDFPPETEADWPTFKPGPFLPSDVESAIKNVTNLLAARPRPISIETAVNMLIEAGLPIKDAEAEVKKIREQDFEGAEALSSATGDEREAFKYLGLEVPDDIEPSRAEPPEPELDPALDPEADPVRKSQPGPRPDPVAPDLK